MIPLTVTLATAITLTILVRPQELEYQHVSITELSARARLRKSFLVTQGATGISIPKLRVQPFGR